ncbi:MAG: hypothetical protein V4596_03350 [Bdellovibrionota bacterium]
MNFLSNKLAFIVYLLIICAPNWSHAQQLCANLFSQETSYNYRIELLRKKASLVTNFFDSNFFDYGKSFYGQHGVTAFEKLNTLNHKFAQLIVDPGVVLRLDEFIRFVKQKKLLSTDPWEAREVFSKSLGTKKIYRALALTDSQAIEISNYGMHSAVVRFDKKNIHEFAIEKDRRGKFIQVNSREQMTFNAHLLEMIRRGGNSQKTRTLSVSEHPEVSLAVAYEKIRYKNIDNKSIYLFELEVPNIDLLYPSMKLGLKEEYDYINSLHIELYIEINSAQGKAKRIPNDNSAEQFILYSASPQEIKSVRKVSLENIGYILVKSYRNQTRKCMGRCP